MKAAPDPKQWSAGQCRPGRAGIRCSVFQVFSRSHILDFGGLSDMAHEMTVSTVQSRHIKRCTWWHENESFLLHRHFFCICCSFTVQKYLELQILHSSAKKVGGRNCTGEGASVHCEVTLWAALQQPLLLILPRVLPAGDASTRETPCQLRGALTAYPFHRIPE